MSKNLKKIVIIIIVISFILTSIPFIFAQTVSNQGEMSELEERLKEIEAEILKGERNLTITQAERQKYQLEVSNIKRRIGQLNVQIRESRSRVQTLTGQIRNTEADIGVVLLEIKDLRGKITEILREVHREDKKSTVEILASEKNISEFFNNSTNLEILSRESRDILGEIVVLRINLEEKKDSLDSKKSETEQLAKIQALEAEEARRIQANQEALLRQVQGRETQQAREVKALREQAVEIRARIFELAGVATTEAPSFGEAYEIAKWVEGITGVRPAFLLAILHQESGIGRNVGQCYMKDPVTANGINIQTGAFVRSVMKPMGLPGRRGDVDDFLIITRELGLDPFSTPVSCPIPAVGGWGGAMGPAQFIPTTWMGYRARVSAVLGRPANPWNIRDAFLASGTLLSSLGAGNQTRDAEWCAAQGYFTGIRCNRNHSFYGNSVMSHADRFQRDINVLDRN